MPKVKTAKTNKASVNLVYKPKKSKKDVKKAHVGQSYRIAFNKMAPSKERRFDFIQQNMFTNGVLANRTKFLRLDAIPQGTSMNDRLGANIHISYVHVNLTLGNSSTKTKYIRLILFREVNFGSFITGTMQFLFKGTGTATTSPEGDSTDLVRPLNKQLVYSIYDTRIKVPPKTEGARYIQRKIRVNKVQKYTPTDETTTTPWLGQFYLLALLSDIDNATEAPQVQLEGLARVFFKDHKATR